MTDRLLRHYAFTLTRADALAFEALPRELDTGARLAFVVLIVVGGVAAGALPEAWTEGWSLVVWIAGVVLAIFAPGESAALAARIEAAGCDPAD